MLFACFFDLLFFLRNVHLQLALLFQDGACECFQDDFYALESIVVACNHIVNRIGIAIGVDEGHDWNAELIRFRDGNMLMTWIDDDEKSWRFAHSSNSR